MGLIDCSLLLNKNSCIDFYISAGAWLCLFALTFESITSMPVTSQRVLRSIRE